MNARNSASIREKLVVKTVHNIRNLRQKEETAQGMYRQGIKLDLQRSRLLTESYRETEGEPMVVRRAKALERILTHMDLYIQDWERIVGNNVRTPQGIYFGIDMNWRSVRRVINSEEGRSLLDDEERKELDELIAYWKGKSMSDIQQKMFSGDILKFWDMSQGGANFWSHWSELGIPNYEKIFKVGLKGLIQEAEERLREIDLEVPVDYIDQKEFLQAVVISLKAVIQFAHRYAALALEKAASSRDHLDKERLEQIARTCRRVPEHPPQTLLEALQSFFFIHVVRYIEFSTLGIGVRFDKVFGPFYENDILHNRTTRDKALELLQLLWVKFHEEVIHTGIGYPSLFNDNAILPLLDHWKVPVEDARDYAVTGCVYIEIPGKNIARRAYGAMILPLALWYALHQGIHPLTGKQSGAATPDPLMFRSADDLMEAYLEQVGFFFDRLCKIENTCQTLYEKYLPRPFYSALLDGCIEKGKDCRKWTYPSSVADFCVILGPANVSDSIAAIKKNVFEDKTVSMEELLTALKADWVGHEDIRQAMIRAPKFGNDDEYTDKIAVEVHHRTAEVMGQSKNRFGYSCRGDGSGISATYGAGAIVPATPDGRKSGDPLSDATLSPVFGMDKKGFTSDKVIR